MKLYSSFGPNPAVVQAFLRQKSQSIETVMLDMMKAESRQEPFLSLNPAGTTPLLQLDDGRYLAESLAICEYLDEVLPGPSLIGDTAEERALTRMWMRRADLLVVQPSANGWRFAEGLDFCRPYGHVIPHAADDLKTLARQGLAWIDRHAGPGHYLAGDRLTLADIFLFVFVEAGTSQNQPIDPALGWIGEWRERLRSEPLSQLP